jgi:hypothetical protein
MRKVKKRKKKLEVVSADGYFERAFRFFNNARKKFTKIEIRHDRYVDDKPVREAAQMVYVAVLQAIKGAMVKKGATRSDLPRREEGYRVAISKLKEKDGRLPVSFETVYENLHILAHYEGGCDVEMIKSGVKNARFIIERLSGISLGEE